MGEIKMDKKKKIKYLLAIYLVIVCLSIILGFAALNVGNTFWQSILINLSTELLGVVLVFFLVNYLFSLEDWDLSERIEKLLFKIEANKEISAQDFFQSPPDLTSHIKNARQIDMCGFTISYVLYNYIGLLKDQVAQGTGIRIIVSDPGSVAIQMSAIRSEIPDDIEHFDKRLARALVDLEYLHKQEVANNRDKSKALEVRLLPFAPNFAIYSFNQGREDAIAFIEAYPHKSGFGKQPWYKLLSRNDPYWHSYFTRQFDDLWNCAKPWDYFASKNVVNGHKQQE
jgi:hypothetical protein